MNVIRPLSLLPLLLLAACASGNRQGAADAAVAETAAEPCNVAVEAARGAPWRLVRGEGFTFCVPTTWRAGARRTSAGVDAHIWRGGQGSITWGTGTYQPQRRTVTVTTVVPASAVGGAGMPPAPPAGASRRSAETIGGYVADVWSNQFEGTHYTGAVWTVPARVHITGESKSRVDADLQLAVYRTVRFVAQ
jgi:hypothetical protein